MICKTCGFDNDKNALFCRKCHANLVEAYLEDYENNKAYRFDDDYFEDEESEKQNNDKNNNQNNKGNKTKTKTKTKNKTKTKEKERTKKEKGRNKNNTVYKEKTPFATKFLIVLMTLIILGLSAVIAFVGYKYYEKNYNIEVPNLVGLTYEQAEVKLAKKDLDITKKEVEVEDESEVGKVISQNKKEGKKVKKNTIIKVKVGVLKETEKQDEANKITDEKETTIDKTDTNNNEEINNSQENEQIKEEDKDTNSEMSLEE